MTDRNINLRVRQTGDRNFRQLVRGLDRVNRSTRNIERSVGGLRNVFFATFGGLGIREIARSADSVQLLSDRIKVFTGDQQSANKALDDLFSAANATNSSVESLAETFNRVALATKELGLNTDQLIGFTATLQNTFRLSGATIAESSAAAIQLSQGLASGQLRGQELRSVLEQNAVIGGILADQLGTTRGQLIKFAESGRITSDVVLSALSERAQEINKQAQNLGQTFGQTLTKAINVLKQRLNEFNRDLRLNDRFAQAVEVLANNLDTLFIAFTGLATLAIPRLIFGLNALRVALLANPVTLIAVAITTTFAAIITKSNELRVALLELSNIFNELKRDFSEFAIQSDILRRVFNAVSPDILANNIINANNAIKENNAELKELRKNVADTEDPFSRLLNAFSNLGNIEVQTNQTVKLSDRIKELNRQLSEGAISLSQYRESLNRVRIQDLEKRFDEGNINAIEFRNQLVAINDLNDNFQEKVFTGFTLAAANYADEIGTITSQLQRAFESTFNRLEDVIFDSLKRGKFLFSDFAQFVLDELTRVAIRTAIISPFANAFAGQIQGIGASQNFGTGFENRFNDLGSSVTAAAKGAVFSGGRQVAFASGGIVNSPTFFPLSSGMGLAGEAGPEAVVPLTRTSDGDLGIKSNPSNVIVNVNNTAGVDVEVESSQLNGDNVLDITISRAVERAFKSGQFDRTLQANFGVNRKGSR